VDLASKGEGSLAQWTWLLTEEELEQGDIKTSLEMSSSTPQILQQIMHYKRN